MLNTIQTKPYYMTNKKWYKIKKGKTILDSKLELTSEAPPEAVKSYKEDKKNVDIFLQ